MSAITFFKARKVNSTNTSIPNPIPRNTVPQIGAPDANSISLFSLADAPKKRLLIIPYAVASDGQNMKFNLNGWALSPGGLSVPIGIIQANINIGLSSTFPGIDGTDIDSTNLFASKIAITNGASTGTLPYYQFQKTQAGVTASDGPISLLLDLSAFPFDLYNIDFSNEGSSTSCNALMAAY